MNQIFKNGFIMAPLKLGYCHDKDGYVNNRHLSFYKKRGEHLGAVILEPLYIDSRLKENPFQLGIDDDDKVEGLSRIVEMLHKTNTKAIAHLNHPGRMANKMIPGSFHWTASEVPCPSVGATPIAMDRTMMDEAIRQLVMAAQRAEKAGFDMIEVQAGYGYLLMQFLSPATNKRADEYGGSTENRMRFPLEVIKAIATSVNIPLICRLTSDEMLPDGFTLNDALTFAHELEKNGVSMIHVTTGSACTSAPWFYQHMFTQKGKTWHDAYEIKKRVAIPVIFHGRINSAEDIQFLKEKYGASYMSLGRALVADENFIAKHLGINHEPIRPCLACSEACLGGVRTGVGLGCVVNPTVNKSEEILETPTAQPKQIVVVGGGLAGMQAALTLKKRGHEVTLFEKKKLGGQFNLASLPPKKESLNNIISYYDKALKHFGVNIKMQEVTPELINSLNPDMVIMATGSIPIIPPIKNISNYQWAEILENLPSGKKVVIIGGGLIGSEVASALVENNNEVTIVEMLDDIARDMEMIERNITLQKLKSKNTTILTDHKVTGVEGNRVIAQSSHGDVVNIDGVDIIVISTGMKSFVPFTTNIPTITIGDATKPAKAQDAIHSAYEVACKI